MGTRDHPAGRHSDGPPPVPVHPVGRQDEGGNAQAATGADECSKVGRLIHELLRPRACRTGEDGYDGTDSQGTVLGALHAEADGRRQRKLTQQLPRYERRPVGQAVAHHDLNSIQHRPAALQDHAVTGFQTEDTGPCPGKEDVPSLFTGGAQKDRRQPDSPSCGGAPSRTWPAAWRTPRD